MLPTDLILQNAIKLKDEKKIKGIYFLIFRGKIVYVGKATDFAGRLVAHKNTKKLKFDSYYIQELDLKNLHLAQEESKYIRKLRPLYNKIGNPDYHSGEKEIWFNYLSIEENTTDISKELGISQDKVIRIVQCRQNKQDEDYLKVKKYIDDRI